MMSTKHGDGNSYKSGDEINQIDWNRKVFFSHVTDYFRKIIAIRKEHPAFRMTKPEDIQKHLKFSKNYMPGVVAYEISENANSDTWRFIQVIFNNNPRQIDFTIGKRKWKVIANEFAVDEYGLTEHLSDTVSVPEVSMMMLVSEG
jgi:pullulanase